MNISFLKLVSCSMTNPVNLLVSTCPISSWKSFRPLPCWASRWRELSRAAHGILYSYGGVILSLICPPSSNIARDRVTFSILETTGHPSVVTRGDKDTQSNYFNLLIFAAFFWKVEESISLFVLSVSIFGFPCQHSVYWSVGTFIPLFPA